jgi:hypothetical protein
MVTSVLGARRHLPARRRAKGMLLLHPGLVNCAAVSRKPWEPAAVDDGNVIPFPAEFVLGTITGNGPSVAPESDDMQRGCTTASGQRDAPPLL